VSSDGYERLLELVAENPALKAEELVEMATGEGFDADEVRDGLEAALEAGSRHRVRRQALGGPEGAVLLRRVRTPDLNPT